METTLSEQPTEVK